MSRKKKKAAEALEIPALAPEDELLAPMTHVELADAFTTLFRPVEEPEAEPVPLPVRRRVSGDEVREIRRQQRREERIAEKGY